MASDALWIVSFKCVVKRLPGMPLWCTSSTLLIARGKITLDTRVFRRRRNYAKMASDALWIVSFKCVVKRLPGMPLWRTSSTLLIARGKITLDTQEINVHEHLIIYFEFDLRRKIILLLHLLFMLSIMAVRCSQTSNILALVHLLLSWSPLIVQDEFGRIVYIVSKIFFLITHLLCAVACVAVSNLLVFLHKSNPSICHSAL